MEPTHHPHQPSNPSTTLTSTKRTFLTRQILLLSSPLTLPTSQPSTDTLPTTTTEPLLSKINKKITSHNRLHFPLQSQRHILEQIEAIYWRDILASGLPITKSETLVGRDVDFTSETGLQTLEVGWDGVVLDTAASNSNPDTVTEVDDGAQQKEQFTYLHKTLRARIDRRDHLRKKVRALKELRRRLEPFENPKENVQPNLVGVGNGNKEIAAEIAKMRVLLVRAEGVVRERNGQVQQRSGDGNFEEHEEDVGSGRSETKRLQDLLELG